MMSKSTFIYILFLWQSANGDDLDDQPIIKTALGLIQGKLVKMQDPEGFDNDVHAFLGIPYAQPPLGALRFRKPVPVSPWNEVYDATQFSDICLQSTQAYDMWMLDSGGVTSEDCLYLNIWTSAYADGTEEGKAVMVFFHGGGFIAGSASQPYFNGQYLASRGNVVIVSMNYRLGALGFLSLGVEDAPGNQGLWDQRMALLWVQEHIASFGGDPNQVTIFGYNAGSSSVGAHLLSPMTRGLFHRAIMQSGTPISPVLLETLEAATNRSLTYAARQGCHLATDTNNQQTTTLKLLDCLRKLDTSQIIELEDEHSIEFPPSLVKLVSGDEFLPSMKTNDLFQVHDPVDLMIGVMANEGSMLLLLAMMQLNSSDFNSTEEAIMFSRNLVSSVSDSVLDNATQLYFQQVPDMFDSDMAKQLAAHLIGDYSVTCPMVYFADCFAKRNSVYFYYFNHRQSDTPVPQWCGVNHGEEIQYLFQTSFFGNSTNVTYTVEETEFGYQLIDLWTTFGKTGKPIVPGIDPWPLYTKDSPFYVELQPNNYKTSIGPNLDNCNFWRDHLMGLY